MRRIFTKEWGGLPFYALSINSFAVLLLNKLVSGKLLKIPN